MPLARLALRALRRSPLVAVALAFAACGTGGEEDLPPATTVVLQATLDGYLVNDGTSVTAGALRVGDTGNNLSVRAFLRFPLASIPPGRPVESAVLTLRQLDVEGNPYAGLDTAVRLDRMDLGAGLDASDFYAIPLFPGVATLSVSAGLGTKNADVTASVQADLAAGRLTSDLRLRFPLETDFDSAIDQTTWESAEDAGGSGDVPILTVTYR